MYEIIDLSQEIYTDAPRFPGHPATKIEFIARHEDMENAPIKPKDITYAAMMLHMCDHGPTHTDAVSHIDERETAPSIDQSPLSMFFTRGIALEPPMPTTITAGVMTYSMVSPSPVMKPPQGPIAERPKE